ERARGGAPAGGGLGEAGAIAAAVELDEGGGEERVGPERIAGGGGAVELFHLGEGHVGSPQEQRRCQRAVTARAMQVRAVTAAARGACDGAHPTSPVPIRVPKQARADTSFYSGASMLSRACAAVVATLMTLPLAAAPGASGAGFEALVLVAHERRRAHLVFNAGGVIEPRQRDGDYRPLAFEAGVDFAYDLDDRGVWSVTASFAAVHFVSIDPDQIMMAAGLAWSPRPWLSLSATGLICFLDGGDRVGIVIGYSQKLTPPIARAGR